MAPQWAPIFYNYRNYRSSTSIITVFATLAFKFSPLASQSFSGSETPYQRLGDCCTAVHYIGIFFYNKDFPADANNNNDSECMEKGWADKSCYPFVLAGKIKKCHRHP
ncbi:MAG: hypothetical protein ACE5HI_08830, partial [bacterium]